MFAPRSRVIVAPLSSGPERRALVVSKVNDADAYVIRYSDGRRVTVAGAQLRPNTKAR